MSTPKTSKYICDSFGGMTDEEIKQKLQEYVDKRHFDDIIKIQVRDVLGDLHSAGGMCVKSYPQDTEKRLKELDGKQYVKVYQRLGDGWGCIYENNQVIEIL